jgi:hypothetical protein
MKKGFLVPVILCASFSSQANDYFWDPVFSSKERYNSNLLLLPNPQQGNWISTLSPGLNVGIRRENDQLKSNFTWNQLFYTNQSALNISEQLFNADYQHNSGRLKWGLSGNYNHQSSLNNTNTVQGLSLTQVMVKQIAVAPTVSYSLTEFSSLDFNYSYNNSTYDKTINSGSPSNYDYQQGSSTFNHLYTEHDKLNVSISGSRYKNSTAGLTTFNNIAQSGWQHSFNDKLMTYISAGMNYSQSDSTSTVTQLIPTNTSTTGFGGVFQASITKTFDRGSATLGGSQNQTPTSQGLQTQSQLTVNTAYNINERWSSALSANYSRYKMPVQANNSSSNDRTYASVSPTIKWQWIPEVNVELSYTYRQQEYKTNNAQLSQDNSVQLQFNYHPKTNNQVK